MGDRVTAASKTAEFCFCLGTKPRESMAIGNAKIDQASISASMLKPILWEFGRHIYAAVRLSDQQKGQKETKSLRTLWAIAVYILGFTIPPIR